MSRKIQIFRTESIFWQTFVMAKATDFPAYAFSSRLNYIFIAYQMKLYKLIIQRVFAAPYC